MGHHGNIKSFEDVIVRLRALFNNLDLSRFAFVVGSVDCFAVKVASPKNAVLVWFQPLHLLYLPGFKLSVVLGLEESGGIFALEVVLRNIRKFIWFE